MSNMTPKEFADTWEKIFDKGMDNDYGVFVLSRTGISKLLSSARGITCQCGCSTTQQQTPPPIEHPTRNL